MVWVYLKIPKIRIILIISNYSNYLNKFIIKEKNGGEHAWWTLYHHIYCMLYNFKSKKITKLTI